MSTFHKIKSITVKGGFLDGASIQFCDNLNCLIGGRGTGKTTVIELIRYALDLMPDIRTEPTKAHLLSKLISSNLGDTNTIIVDVEADLGLKYSIQRTCGKNSAVIKDKDGIIMPNDFRRKQIFDVEIYSQNDIENAASCPRDQLEIIDKFREDDLNAIAKDSADIVRKLENNAADILSTKSQLASLQDDVSDIDVISEKLKAVTIDTGEDPEEVTQHGSRIQAVKNEQRHLKNLIDGIENSETDLFTWLESYQGLIDMTFSRFSLASPNRNQIDKLQLTFTSTSDQFNQGVQSLFETLSSLRQESDQVGRKIEDQILTLQEEYDEVLAKHQEVKGKVREREKLQKLYDELLIKQNEYEELLEKEETLFTDRKDLIEKLSELCDHRYSIRQAIAESINKRLKPMIRVQIIPMGNPVEYQTLLLEAMKHSQMQYTKIVDRIVKCIPPYEFVKLVQNCQVDALMEKLELERERANKIIAQLQNTREIFDIEIVELYDRPLIELKDGTEYKAADSLSTGQKCTTILPILLLESVKPLIIDQPEDNLDNAFVYDTVVKSIRSIKQGRQLIFVTHNPNIPVLGNAEKVFVLHSDGRQGKVVTDGNVDDVKDEIETILEGGRDAFEERRRRYGH